VLVRFLIIFLVFASSSSIAGESWVQLDQTSFLDKNSIVKNGKFVRVWIKDTSGKNGLGQKMWEGTLAAYDIDCELRTSLLTAFYFLQTDGRRTPPGPSKPDVIEPIAPGSFLDVASQTACKKWYEVWK